MIGTRQFVSACYQRFEDCFACKQPQPVAGVDGVFSLKRLRKPA